MTDQKEENYILYLEKLIIQERQRADRNYNAAVFFENLYEDLRKEISETDE